MQATDYCSKLMNEHPLNDIDMLQYMHIVEQKWTQLVCETLEHVVQNP